MNDHTVSKTICMYDHTAIGKCHLYEDVYAYGMYIKLPHCLDQNICLCSKFECRFGR